MVIGYDYANVDNDGDVDFGQTLGHRAKNLVQLVFVTSIEVYKGTKF